jgi:hypothetical protein
MNISDAIYEYAKTEIIPVIANGSDFTAGLVNGILRAGRKKISVKISDNSMLKAVGIVKDDGNVDAETLKEFIEGVFEERAEIPITLADLLKATTGIDSDNELLQDKIKITRADAEKLIELIMR